MASTKEKGKKASGKASGTRLHIADTVQSLADSLRKELTKRTGGSTRKAKIRGADLAVSAIKMQRSAVDKAFKIVTRVQESADKAVKGQMDDADWLPDEGKDIVKEWSRTLADGRAEFQKTVDKSYDLLRGYFERVKREQRTSGKKAAAPKSKAKKKSRAKRPAKAKPAAETAPPSA